MNENIGRMTRTPELPMADVDCLERHGLYAENGGAEDA